MKPVQLGLVGCGVIGQAHLRAAASLPPVRFVAVCDVRKEAADHLEQALVIQQLTDAIYQAATTRKCVEVK